MQFPVGTDIMQLRAEASDKHASIATMLAQSRDTSNNHKEAF